MMKKFGIKKTKGNVILLFIVGMLVGIILGLRQPVTDTKSIDSTTPVSDTTLTQATVENEAEGAIKLGAESPIQEN